MISHPPYSKDTTVPTQSLFLPHRDISWEMQKPLIMAFCISHRIGALSGSLKYTVPIRALWSEDEFLERVSSLGNQEISSLIFSGGAMEGTLEGNPSLPLLKSPPMISVRRVDEAIKDSQLQKFVNSEELMDVVLDSFMRLVRFLLEMGSTLDKCAPLPVREAYEAFLKGERSESVLANAKLVKLH